MVDTVFLIFSFSMSSEGLFCIECFGAIPQSQWEGKYENLFAAYCDGIVYCSSQCENAMNTRVPCNTCNTRRPPKTINSNGTCEYCVEQIEAAARRKNQNSENFKIICKICKEVYFHSETSSLCQCRLCKQFVCDRSRCCSKEYLKSEKPVCKQCMK